MPEFGILGGGISGLSLAYLSKNSEVLEKESIAGGLARSISEQGYTFDLGSHIVFSKDDSVLDFMLTLLGENKIKHRRNAQILYKGRFVKYPFENGLDGLPFNEAMDCALSYAQVYLQNKAGVLEQPANFAQWMHNRFGRGITQRYLYPYNKKIWSTLPEQMATFWVEGRVPQPPLLDVLKSSMGLRSEGYLHQLYFYYPKRGGYQALTDALAKTIGSRLKTSFKVSKIKKEENFVVEGNKETKQYKSLVSTIHILDFLKAYAETPKEIMGAARALRWNSAYLVMIGLKNPKITDIDWLYISDEDVLPNRVSFPSNYSHYVAPKGYSSVLAEITFHPSDIIAREDPEKIKLKTIKQLASLGLFREDEVTFSKIITIPYAYVVYDLAYQENISKIQEFVNQEGITLLGRFSEFKYYNADKCIGRAMEVANEFSL